MVSRLAKLKEGEIVIYVTPASKYVNTNNRILDHYVNGEKFYCIYVTMNRPYAEMVRLFKERKIGLERMFFIDAVTPINTGGMLRSENAVFVGSPRNLTSVSIVLSSTMKPGSREKRILFLDSLSSMLLYNGVETGTKFMHFLINKMREWHVSSAILSLEKETDEKTLSQLAQMCDRIVELD